MNKKMIIYSIIFITTLLIIVSIFFITSRNSETMFENLFESKKDSISGYNLIPQLGDASILTEERWTVTSSSGEESQLTFWASNTSKKTELGWIPPNNSCTGWVDKYLSYENDTRIKDDKNKDISLKCESSKCNGQNCFHISLTEAQAINIDDYVKLGENSIVTEYQEQSKINYITDWGASSNITLYENLSDVYELNIGEIWIIHRNVSDKFGANHSNMSEDEVRSFRYVVESTSQIIDNRNKPYIYRTIYEGTPRRARQERHVFDFTDICSKSFDCSGDGEYRTCNKSANCEFEYYTVFNNDTNDTLYYLNVTFYSDKFIDPTIEIDEFTDSNSIRNNITQENNFTHLEISDDAPYDNLLLYMPFDVNQSSTTVYDWTDYGNDGTINGNPTWNESLGIFGSCYEFDGSNDRINMTPVSQFDNNAFTVSIWVKNNNNASAGVIDIFVDDYSNLELTWESDETYEFTLDGAVIQDVNSDLAYTDLDWHHIIMRFNTTTMNMWVDGDKQSTSELNTGVDPIGNMYFGGYTTEWNGFIDEAMIFNVSLTEQQISDIYNNQSARFKTTGTQELKQFNMSIDNNWLKVSEDDEQLFGSELSKRIGYWDVSKGYNDSVDGASVGWNDGDGLVGYWHFDNLSANGENDTHVFDYSGNGNNGSVIGGTDADSGWSSSGVYNGGQMFDGDGDYVHGDYDDSLNMSNKNLTLSAWIYNLGDRTQYQTIIMGGISPTGYQMYLEDNSLDLNYYSTSSGVKSSDVSITPNTWNHVSIVLNGTHCIYYINGLQVATDSCVISDTDDVDGLGIGARPDGNYYFNGSMDEVMIYNRSLSASEIKQLYVKGRANFEFTDYKDADQEYFNVDEGSTNFLLDYNFTAGNYTDEFYSPILKTSSVSPVNVTTDGGDIGGCSVLAGANQEYSLTQNASSTGTCFTVTAPNVTLNCNGYEINYSYSDILGYGVYSNQFNTTVKNCVIKEGVSGVNNKYGVFFEDSNNHSVINNSVTTLDSVGRGMFFDDTDDVIVANNTISAGDDGIFTDTVTKRMIVENNIIISIGKGIYFENDNGFVRYNNITTSVGVGIFVYYADHNIITYNNVSSYGESIYTFVSRYNNISFNNLNLTGSFAYGIRNYDADNSNIINNIISTTEESGAGLQFSITSNTNIYNTTIKTTGSSGRGIIISNDNYNNIFINNNITTTSATTAHGIYIDVDKNNNTFIDCNINVLGGGTSKDIYMDDDVDAGSFLKLINVTYNKSNVEILAKVTGTGENLLISQEYLDVNVTDSSDDSAISGAIVNVTYNNGTLIFSNITDATGITLRQNVTEFWQNSTDRIYLTNYTINVTASGFNQYNDIFNLTGYTMYNVSMSSGASPPDESPVTTLSLPADDTNYTNGTTVTFECNATDDFSLSNATLYIWNSTGDEINTSTNDLTGTDNSTTFTYNLTYDDIYDWNCLVRDNNSQSDWGNSNWSVNITTFITPAVDNEYPVFSLYDVNISNNSEYNALNYKVNVSLLSTNGTIGIEFNGTNYTASNDSANEFYVTIPDLQRGTYSYFWWGYGNGTSTNFNTSNTQYYTVSQNSSYQLLLTGTTPISYGTSGDFEGTLCPSQLTCILYRNGSNVSNPDTTVLGVDVYNYTYNTTGNNNYSSYSNSSELTVNTVSSSVNLTLNSTDNNVSISNNTNIDLNCSTITGDSSATLELFNNGTSINSGTSPIGNITLFNKVAVYNITCFYTSSQNYSLSYETWWINISTGDLVSPTVSIIYPTNTIYGSTTLDLNYTASDETALSSCWYNNGTNSTPQSPSTNWTSVTGSEGSNTWYVYCNDTSNNEGSDSVTFDIDTIPPNLGIESPFYLLTNYSWVDFNITANDSSPIDMCWYVVGENNLTMQNDSQNHFHNLTNWSDGTYFVYFYCNDTSGNINDTEWNFFIVDTIPPVFDNINNISIFQNESVYQDINASDSGNNFDSFRINWTSNFTINRTSGELTNISLLGIGIHYIEITINDSATWETSMIIWVNVTASEIDTTPPNIYYIPPTPLNNSYRKQGLIWHNVSIFDLSNISNVTFWTYNITSDCVTCGKVTYAYNENQTERDMTFDGYYMINATICDIYTNCNTTKNRYYTVDSIKPYFTAIDNLSVYDNESIYENINASDIVSFSCFSVNDTNFNINCSGTLTNATILSIGLYYLNITINDSANNINSSIMLVNVSNSTIPDITPPYFDELPADQTVSFNTPLYYEINASDETLLDSYTVNDSLFIIGLTGVLQNNTLLGVGTYPINITINDSSNNLNSTEIIITVTQISSSVDLKLNNTGSNISISNNTNIDLNCTSTGDSSATLTLYNDGALVDSGTSPIGGIEPFIVVGVYNISCFYLNTQNYSASYETWWVNVTPPTLDTTPPTFDNLINHTHTVNTSFTYDLDASDTSGIDTFTLNDTSYFNISSTGIIQNVTNLSEEMIYWLNVSVNDTVGNILTEIFYINITIPAPLVITGLSADDMYIAYNYENTIQGDMIYNYAFEY